MLRLMKLLPSLLALQLNELPLRSGFPSVGKSTLLNKLTGTFSEVAGYECAANPLIPVECKDSRV